MLLHHCRIAIEKDQKSICILYTTAACIWCITACSDLIPELWLRWIDSYSTLVYYYILPSFFLFLPTPLNAAAAGACVPLCIHSRRGYWMLIVDLRSIQSPCIIHNSINVHIALTLDSSFFFFLLLLSPLIYLAADLAASVCCVWNSSSVPFSPLFDRPSFRYFYDFCIGGYTMGDCYHPFECVCVCVIRPLSPRSISLITRLGGSTKGLLSWQQQRDRGRRKDDAGTWKGKRWHKTGTH